MSKTFRGGKIEASRLQNFSLTYAYESCDNINNSCDATGPRGKKMLLR